MIEGQIQAWKYVIDKFRDNGGTLSTYDFITDIRTAAEYRRILCDIKKKGYHVISKKITPKHWEYILCEADETGQLQIAI